jgi:hypothetical protein
VWATGGEAGADVTGLERILAGSVYAEKAAQIRSEKGLWGLLSRALHKLASPVIDWGGITFFERKLDSSVLRTNPPSGISIREMDAAEIETIRDGIDPTRDIRELVNRFRRGDNGFAAIDSRGKSAHVRWVTRSRACVPEIGCDIELAPHEAYFYDGYTRPELRRRGIDGAVRSFIFDTLQADGCTTVYSYVRRDNPAGFRAASRSQTPIGTVWYVRIGGLRPLVMSTSRAALPRLIPTRAEGW